MGPNWEFYWVFPKNFVPFIIAFRGYTFFIFFKGHFFLPKGLPAGETQLIKSIGTNFKKGGQLS